MNTSNKRSEILKKIRELVKQIPAGKVATYGDIANKIGIKDARMVGWAIRGNNDPKIPCWRVVKSDGSLATNYSLGNWEDDRIQLISEGIEFIEDAKVNLRKFRWK